MFHLSVDIEYCICINGFDLMSLKLDFGRMQYQINLVNHKHGKQFFSLSKYISGPCNINDKFLPVICLHFTTSSDFNLFIYLYQDMGIKDAHCTHKQIHNVANITLFEDKMLLCHIKLLVLKHWSDNMHKMLIKTWILHIFN